MASAGHGYRDGGDGGGSTTPATRRRLRALLLLQKREALPEENPFLLASGAAPQAPKKKGFAIASVALRGLGCTSSSAAQVHAPSSGDAAAAVRSSADWQAKRSRRSGRKKGKVKKKDRDKAAAVGGPPPIPLPPMSPPPPHHHHHRHQQRSAASVRRNHAAVAAADVWCSPGIGLSEASVDCVAPLYQHHLPPGRGRAAAATAAAAPTTAPGPGPAEFGWIQREDPYVVRRGPGAGGNPEQLSAFLDSPQSSLETPLFGDDLVPPYRQLYRSRRIRRSPGGLDEIMMFQARFLLGEMDMHDQYRDWRLDVDNMTYEELLELGDRIGYVNTGLREEEIYRCMRKMKHSKFSSLLKFSTDDERKCSICQEDYEINDEMGKLDCGHSYHTHCIKQWLVRKNSCPVCKAPVAKA